VWLQRLPRSDHCIPPPGNVCRLSSMKGLPLRQTRIFDVDTSLAWGTKSLNRTPFNRCGVVVDVNRNLGGVMTTFHIAILVEMGVSFPGFVYRGTRYECPYPQPLENYSISSSAAKQRYFKADTQGIRLRYNSKRAALTGQR
jgi:hypothetical protein